MKSPAAVDVPVYIPSRGEHLGAVVTVPAGRPEASVGVILAAGRARDRTHRNGTWVATAHALAEAGIYALRLDYPGVGHSTGEPAVFSLEEPPTWAVRDAAAFLVGNTPVRRVLLAGSCFGGRLVLQSAPLIPEVAGVAAAAIPAATRRPSWKRQVRRAVLGRRRPKGDGLPSSMRLRQHREGNAAAGRQPSRELIRALRAAVRRGTRLYFLYGEQDFTYHEFVGALPHMRLPAGAYEIEVVPGAIHAFASAETQGLLRDRVVRWARAVAAEPGPAPAVAAGASTR
ncbi:MAG TPA: alpha/beta hydrolase, partial [Actinomycetota bacterium]|nr:alpha/beta hydrolase [Actinomycetota bacterium]